MPHLTRFAPVGVGSGSLGHVFDWVGQVRVIDIECLGKLVAGGVPCVSLKLEMCLPHAELFDVALFAPLAAGLIDCDISCFSGSLSVSFSVIVSFLG